jgi:hypothetical protein
LQVLERESVTLSRALLKVLATLPRELEVQSKTRPVPLVVLQEAEVGRLMMRLASRSKLQKILSDCEQ